jgi:hypothetical protein
MKTLRTGRAVQAGRRFYLRSAARCVAEGADASGRAAAPPHRSCADVGRRERSSMNEVEEEVIY